jgi:hypothetical protein
MVSSKKKWTVMNPIRRRMKKCKASSGQNGQLVHWWLLVHSGHSSPIQRLVSCSEVGSISRSGFELFGGLRASPAVLSMRPYTNIFHIQV